MPKNQLVPIYATTKRVAKERRNGENVHREYIFEHVQFKMYKYYDLMAEIYVAKIIYQQVLHYKRVINGEETEYKAYYFK